MADETCFDKYPLNGTFDEFKAPDITAWKLARAAIEHENNLINQRLTWLSASQVFLFSAFGVLFLAWARNELQDPAPTLVPVLLIVIGAFAIYSCIAIQISLLHAFAALGDITVKYKNLVKEHHFGARVPPLHRWRKPPFLGIFDQHFLPAALAVLWVVILGVLVFFRSPSLMSKLGAFTFTMSDAIVLLLVCFAGAAGALLHSWLRTRSSTSGFD